MPALSSADHFLKEVKQAGLGGFQPTIYLRRKIMDQSVQPSEEEKKQADRELLAQLVDVYR
jgi:hypothetical protein